MISINFVINFNCSRYSILLPFLSYSSLSHTHTCTHTFRDIIIDHNIIIDLDIINERNANLLALYTVMISKVTTNFNTKP